MEKLVSVIIPSFNGSKTIERAINSVLTQTYQNFEIIVVNDLSTDNLKQVVANISDKRITMFDVDKKVSASYARNFGVARSSGEYIAFLDDDDAWKNLKIEKQVGYLKNNPNCLGVITDYFSIHGDNKKLINTYSNNYTQDILLMNVQMAAGSNLLVTRDAFDRLDGFDINFNGHQDLEFAIRLDQLSPIGHISGGLLELFGHSNRVAKNSDRLVTVKELYLNKFKEIISSYTIDISNRIYARQWLQVARNYSIEGNYSKSKEYLDKSLSFGLLKSKYIPFLPFESYYLIILRNVLNRFLKISR